MQTKWWCRSTRCFPLAILPCLLGLWMVGVGQVGVAQAAILILSEDYESGKFSIAEGGKWDTAEPGGCTASTAKPRTGSFSLQIDASKCWVANTGAGGTSKSAYLSFWQWFPVGYSWGPDDRAHWPYRFYSAGWVYQLDNVAGENNDTKLLYHQVCFIGPGLNALLGPLGTRDATGQLYSCEDDDTLLTMADGRWHHVEVYLRQNTPGQADGIYQVWYDGQRYLTHQNKELLPPSFTGSLLDTLQIPSNIGNECGGTATSGCGPGVFAYLDDVELWTDCPTTTLYSGVPTCAGGTAPSTPANLTATATSSSQIAVSWSASTDNIGVTGYRVERCPGSTCTSFIQIATPSGTSYSDLSLTANTTYRYRVRAADAAGNLSGYSAIASATTLAGCLRGDLDCNGTVDLDDLRRMIYMLVGTVPVDLTTADLDGDGQLLLADLQALVRILVGIP